MSTKFNIIFISFLLLLSGCATMKKDSHLWSYSKFTPESQVLWARPTEVSYKFEAEIEGSAEIIKVFGFTVEGEAPEINIAGFLPTTDALVKFAVLNAVLDSKVDGMYVTATIIKKTGLWPFYVRKKAVVKGKSLILKNLGEVDQKRFDNERSLMIQYQK